MHHDQRSLAWAFWGIHEDHFDRVSTPIGGIVRPAAFVSGLPGFNALTALLDQSAWHRHHLPWPIEISCIFTDDPINRPEQVKVATRLWQRYTDSERRRKLREQLLRIGEALAAVADSYPEAVAALAEVQRTLDEPSSLLEFTAHHVPDLARSYGIPVCYDHPQSAGAREFLRKLGCYEEGRQKYVLNTAIACTYHGWIGRELRQMCGERSHRGGRAFNVHPNNAAGDMRSMNGIKPIERLVNGSGSGFRVSLLRMVPGKFDDPDFILGSTSSSKFGPRMKEVLPERNRHWLLHLLVSQKVGDLLHEHLPRQLMIQLCAETNVEMEGKVPTCPSRPYSDAKPVSELIPQTKAVS